jgi:hypothetical protein
VPFPPASGRSCRARSRPRRSDCRLHRGWGPHRSRDTDDCQASASRTSFRRRSPCRARCARDIGNRDRRACPDAPAPRGRQGSSAAFRRRRASAGRCPRLRKPKRRSAARRRGSRSRHGAADRSRKSGRPDVASAARHRNVRPPSFWHVPSSYFPPAPRILRTRQNDLSSVFTPRRQRRRSLQTTSALQRSVWAR